MKTFNLILGIFSAIAVSVISVSSYGQVFKTNAAKLEIQSFPIQPFTPEGVMSEPPAYLATHVNQNSVELSWGVSGSLGTWLSYDNGVPGSSVGLAEPGLFTMAIRYPASALVDFVGQTVSKVAFLPASSYTTYTFKIWKGANAGFPVYNKTLSNLNIGEWNEVMLNTPLLLESNEEYWFGIVFNQLKDSEFPASFDTGPAIQGFGDMINLGGEWAALASLGFDYNWLLQVFVDQNSNPENLSPGFITELIGYNIYRDSVKLNATPYNDAYFTDENLAAGVYLYGLTAVYDSGESLSVEKFVQIDGPELTLDAYFISTTLTTGEVFTTDLTLTNNGVSALSWSLSSLPAGFTFSSVGGTIDANSSQIISLSITSSGMSNGVNNYIIGFNTNDLNQPVTTVIASITVYDQPDLYWDKDVLNFGMTPVFQTKLKSALLTNGMDATIFLFNFNTGTNNYTAYPPTWAIAAGESLEIPISFTASGAGISTDTLFLEYFSYTGSDILKLPLSGEGVILPPSNISTIIDGGALTLSWMPPGASPDVLRFGNGEPFAIIGTSGPGTFEFVHRFTPEDLMVYAGKQLDQVGFYIGSNNALFKLKVYTDEEGEIPFINLPVSNLTPDAWNDIALPFPISIDALDYLWIGYEITLSQLEFIAGVDGGPGIAGSGDLMKNNGNPWNTLNSLGLSYNWNIRGLLSDDDGESMMVLSKDNSQPEAFNLLGYNVYRDGVLLGNTPPSVTSYLDIIIPGENYIYGVSAVYDYGESLPAEILVVNPASLVMPSGWDFVSTSIIHSVHVPVDVLQIGVELNYGDMVGVFYHDNGVEKCAGAGLWTGEHLIVKAYGNDPATAQKDGFDTDEILKWKVFNQSIGLTKNLEVGYDSSMPHHDGQFKMMGLSMLEIVEMGTTSVYEAEPIGVVIFPNPSNGLVSVSNVLPGAQITVYDLNGRVVHTGTSEGQTYQMILETAGMYIVEIIQANETKREKLIIR